MVLPQAVRRVAPPLLNDFVALQKDVVLVSVLGITGEAFRTAQIENASSFNYTPLIAAALCFLCDHDSPGADRRPAQRRDRGVGPMSGTPVLEITGVTKAFGSTRSCAESTWRWPSTRRWR